MYKKIFKKVLAVMLCLSFLVATVTVEPVQAKRAAGESVTDYLNRCYNSITNILALNPMPKVIALAYLVGEDDMAAASWDRNTVVRHEMYAVDPNTVISGYKYSSRFYPQDNVEYLKDVKYNYGQGLFGSNKIENMPEGAQYLEREGCMFMVVACDEEWVTVWDNGYQSWDLDQSAQGSLYSVVCHGSPIDTYLETHPPGFYKIQRNKVWIDFSLKENHPYTSEAAIPKAGNGVVTKLVDLRPVPDEGEKTYTPVYALTTGTEVNVVSTQLVPSKTPGSTVKYYKVSFSGSEEVQNNRVGYLGYKVPGVYYLDSRYLNVTWKGAKTPTGAVPGVITNTTSTSSVYVYQSKDTGSQRIGVLSLNAEIEMLPSESDANWTTVYFSGQKGYVQTKFIKKGLYKVTDISAAHDNLVADVVKDQIKIGWNEGKNNVEYSCSISMTKGKKKKVLWSNKHYKKNSFIIKRKYIEKATALDIEVQATDKNGNKGKKLEDVVFLPRRESKINKKLIVIGKNKIKGKFAILGQSLQYSTNKKFKKAVTVEKYGKEKGTKGKVYKAIMSIKKLKKNKTYYIRRREKMEVETQAGNKWISGKWSKSIKIKTKK